MAVKKFAYVIDLLKNEIRNAVLHVLASAPSSPSEGQLFYNSTSKKPQFWNGTSWVDWGTGAASGDVSGPASSVDGQLTAFSGTTGKSIAAVGLTGLLKAASGVPAVAVPGTDYVTGSSTNALTNKTFDANGTGNTLSNVEAADFAAGVINTSTSLAGATNSQIPTAAAVKAYADGLLAANDAMVLRGGIDASANPNYPAGNAGDTYKITVAGRIGGASGPLVAVGDTIYCTVDSTVAGNHATVGASWTIVQANVDTATESTAGLVVLATLAEAEAKTNTTKAVTPNDLTNFPIKRGFTFGDGTAVTFALTHNLGTTDVVVQIFKISTGETWDAGVTRSSTSVVTVEFTGYVPSANEFRAVVIG